MAYEIPIENDTKNIDTQAEVAKKGPRLFTKFMRSLCWKNAKVVPNRDPDRWRFDSVGNIVCKAFTNCDGLLCYEYDHIIPYSKGGETSVENCQILQTRVNRIKKDLIVEKEEMVKYSRSYEFSNEELDLVEMSVYGDIKRADHRGSDSVSFVYCQCKIDENIVFGKKKNFKECTKPSYENRTPIV